jgi:sulfoxide reductase heme-binding subunit YedZ
VVAGRRLAGLDAGGGVLTWIVARAAGFTAYGLLTGSVVLGLALGLRWRSPRWPRWATTELHRFVTLLTLVFLGLHVLLLALDGYMRFRPVVHGLQAGSDGHRPWALTVYAASALMVAGLTAARLAGARRPAAQRPLERIPAERV